MSLRVAVDARYLRRAGVGISVYLRDFIAELAGSELEVTLLASQPAHVSALRDSFPGCRVAVLPERREVLWEQLRLPPWLERERPDVYVAGANRGLPWRSPPGTRLVLIVHDLIPLRMPRTHLLADPFAAFRFLLGTAISLARADLVVANSHSTAADVRRLRSGSRVAVRYPIVPSVDGAGEAPSLPPDWPSEFLLYCGGADPRKNLEGLIAAHQEYRRRGGELPLVVLGFGQDALRERLRREGRADGVRFAGFASEALKWAALRRAQAMLYPSRWEGFGLPILEALSVGTPVLAGRGGAQPEAGGDAAAYVDVDDRAALASAIAEVTAPEWRRRARQRGPVVVARLRAAHRQAADILAETDHEDAR